MPTSIPEFLDELNGGVFVQKLSAVLSEAALKTTEFGSKRKTAKVTVEFTLTPMNDCDQVMIAHKLQHAIPTKRGKKTEEDTTETPMFVGPRGALSISQPKVDPHGHLAVFPGTAATP